MNNKNTKELLEKHQIVVKKRWGQNFINDQNIIKKMVKLSKIDESMTVIEIGPGLGILTKELAKMAHRVLAFEIDTTLVRFLNGVFCNESKVEIIEADFLSVDLNDYFLSDISNELAVCANLPYYITTAILFKLFNSGLTFKSISVMMQKEMAERFSAQVKTKGYNALTVITSYKYHSKQVLKVPKEVFYPMPRVDSAVVLLTAKEKQLDIDEEDFFALVKSCFKYRRKTIYNNLKEYTDEKNALLALEKAEILANQRAQELSLQQYLQLFAALNENKNLR